MGSKFSIADDSVNRHSANLDSSVSSLNGNLTQFRNAVEGLPHVWKGKAFHTWHDLQEQWDQAARNLNNALAGIRSRVGDAGRLYDQYHAQMQEQTAKTAGSANWGGAQSKA